MTTGTTGGHYHRHQHISADYIAEHSVKYVTDSGQGVTGHGSDGVEIPAVRQSRISEGARSLSGEGGTSFGVILASHLSPTKDQVAAIKYPLFRLHYCRYLEH